MRDMLEVKKPFLKRSARDDALGQSMSGFAMLNFGVFLP